MRRPLPPGSQVALSVACAAAVLTLAAIVLAPVYGPDALLLPASAATVTGLALAVLSERLRWSWGLSVLFAIAGYAVGALLLATPGAVSASGDIVTAAVQVLIGPVVGWKGVVTLPAPLGTYEGVMVPAYALLFFGSWAAVSFSLRVPRRWWIGPVVAAATFLAAIVIGPERDSDAAAIVVGTHAIARETLIGVGAFAALLGWFIARGSLERARLKSAAGARSRTPGRLRAIALASGAAMAVAAVAATMTISSSLPSVARSVARTGVEASTAVARAETPLSTYRAFMSDDLYDVELFSVEGAGDADRVRLAVLPYYDEDRYLQAAPTSDATQVFRRLPARLLPVSGTDEATVAIAGLTGPWTPLVGDVIEVGFGGGRAAQLVDSFYYVEDGGSGIVTLGAAPDAANGGLTAGDEIYESVMAAPAASLGEAVAGAPADSLAEEMPELAAWVDAQAVGRDAAGLQLLVERLRERGYLSHAVIASGEKYLWQEALPGLGFEASAAGHSTTRLEDLFAQLNDRAEQTQGDPKASLVAAVGDDEQFAAASALIATYLGFDARVVVGARLADTDGDRGWTPPACEDGVCRGRNISAWVEIATPTGWAALDTSPQIGLALEADVTSETPPEFATDLRNDQAEVEDPPSSQRSRSGEATEDDGNGEDDDEEQSRTLRIVAISGVGVLALLLPLIVLIAWKAARRARRRGRRADDAIRAGWQQYLDDAADAGLPPAGPRTYSEVSAAYGSPHGPAIAALATKVDFSHLEVGVEETEAMWRLVREDRRHWLSARSWSARIRMRLSLRSLLRDVRRDAAQVHVRAGAGRSTWKTDRTAVTRSRVETRSRSRRNRRKGDPRD
ncbi:transglutaminase domain-containing protein [Demequina subtropica]|uniref:transglutaminase domain-containing protein n=1 Tax=Demequina subtropica TaxID=1638989 RepID=UPI0007815FDE|nr:transglutaminase domain-containing protein [Demequina subtropica]